jgi:hypothetical protein
MWRTAVGLLVVVVALAVVAVGCASSGRDGSAGAPASTAAAATSTIPPATASSTTTTTPSAEAARCSNAVLRKAAQKALGDSGSTMPVVSITLTRCRNGYALLSAHPAGNAESPNVFLVWRSATQSWETLDLGTGIDCAGSPIGPKLTAACKALGYPVRG